VKKHLNFELLLPLFVTVVALVLHKTIPNNKDILYRNYNYFSNLLIILIIIFSVLIIVAKFNTKIKKTYTYKSRLIAGAIFLLCIYNLITLKFNLIPEVYFPYPDKVINVFFRDYKLLLKCLLHSLRLLFTGVISGGIAGIITGVCVGWSKKLNYWLAPLVKFIGPIPATIWIPIALVVFPTSFGASAFIVALSMWFPTSLMTSSGIQNLEKSYFEVAKTLGSPNYYQLLRIAIPGALPSIFTGFFNGITSSFITLITAEMIGVKYGIGWYVNWQREVMSFANVYAGLIVIGVMCSLVLTIMFRVRDKLLTWQKGVINW